MSRYGLELVHETERSRVFRVFLPSRRRSDGIGGGEHARDREEFDRAAISRRPRVTAALSAAPGRLAFLGADARPGGRTDRV
jgi:hypothetical protein